MNKTKRQAHQHNLRIEKHNMYVTQYENCTQRLKTLTRQLQQIEEDIRRGPKQHQNLVQRNKLLNQIYSRTYFQQYLLEKINRLQKDYLLNSP